MEICHFRMSVVNDNDSWILGEILGEILGSHGGKYEV
jgi:hypothetical protein